MFSHRPSIRLQAYGIAAVGWVLLALVRTALRIAAIPRPFGTALAIFGQLLLASLPWLLVAPAIVALAARLPWQPGRRVRTAVTLAAIGIAFSVVDSMWGRLVLPLAGYPMTLSAGVWYLVRLDQALFTYAALVGLGVALRHRRRLDQARLRGAQLEARLIHARLHVLALQLHPHFLFNTLNAVSELVHRDAVAARRMLDSLRELLSRSLDGDAAQEVPLAEELALLEPYATIQRTRFAGSLTIRVEPDPGSLSALVPRLVLQPLVENAIRHGTARRAGPGTITVRTRAHAGWLVIEVEDDGAGLVGSTPTEGLGLGNTRARLGRLYGGAARLFLIPAAERGTLARLECPLRMARTPPAGGTTGEAGCADEQPAEPYRPLSVPAVAARVAAGALAVAILGACADFIGGHLAGTPDPFRVAAALRIKETALWLILAPPVLLLSARLARARIGWSALLGLQLSAGLATIAVHLGLVGWLAYPLNDGNLTATVLVNDLCVYAALAVGAHAWTVRGAAAERRAEADRLDADLAAARLELVRWRLRPELVYQALDRIGRLSESSPDDADELTGRLGELLRLILQTTGAELIPLGHETAILAAYLGVDGAVRGLPTSLDLSLGPSTSEAPVPAMLLLSLVETLGGTQLAVAASCAADGLELSLRSRPAEPSRLEQELGNLEHRLERAVPGASRLAVHWIGAEARVLLRLPAASRDTARAVA
jgi:LytS/YehU family sensor histidine kinase